MDVKQRRIKMQITNELETLSHNIVRLRKKHGLSKKEMASILGIGVKSLSRIENGDFPKRIGVHLIINIWEHFGILPQQQISKQL